MSGETDNNNQPGTESELIQEYEALFKRIGVMLDRGGAPNGTLEDKVHYLIALLDF